MIGNPTFVKPFKYFEKHIRVTRKQRVTI